jgi:7-cyano-7-deazaguanine synthase
MTLRACVLLSGGMDSVACLHWAKAQDYDEVRAVGFSYGQAHRDAELVSAGRAAHDAQVLFEVVEIADGLHGGILGGVVPHDEQNLGINRAFVPGRNLVFLSLALSRSSQWWPFGAIDLVIGSCKDDAAGFPDCRGSFFSSASETMSAAIDRAVQIVAPWAEKTKARVLREIELLGPDALIAVQQSWSCYRGLGASMGPCGNCTACVMRRRAFLEVGIEDRSTVPRMFGGDPGRAR